MSKTRKYLLARLDFGVVPLFPKFREIFLRFRKRFYVSNVFQHEQDVEVRVEPSRSEIRPRQEGNFQVSFLAKTLAGFLTLPRFSVFKHTSVPVHNLQKEFFCEHIFAQKHQTPDNEDMDML